MIQLLTTLKPGESVQLKVVGERLHLQLTREVNGRKYGALCIVHVSEAHYELEDQLERALHMAREALP